MLKMAQWMAVPECELMLAAAWGPAPVPSLSVGCRQACFVFLQEASPHTSLYSPSSSQLLRMNVDSIQTAGQQVDLMRCEGCSCQGLPGVPGRESQLLTPHLRCQKRALWPCVRPRRPGIVVPAWIPSAREKEAGRLQVWHHLELL